MPKEVETVVHVGDGWCFCGHLKESCNECCIDHRGSNNWVRMERLLKKSGWPQSDIDRILEDELEIERRPALQIYNIASKAGRDRDAYKCNTHEKKDCSICFDFGTFLLQDVGLWDQHLMHLKKAGLPVPTPLAPPPPGIFERKFPRLRGFPDITAASLTSAHALAFKYPNFRLLNQLPAFVGHSPLGWVLFGTIVARQGPGMIYTIQDASGATVRLQFVQSWALEGGGGGPTGADAEQYKNLAPGTLLSLKCVTMGLTLQNQAEVAVEKINLSGVKILKCSLANVYAINNKLRKATPGCCSHCAKPGAPSSCLVCKAPYCNKDCQANDWKERGHKKACSVIAHLRSLNCMFADS